MIDAVPDKELDVFVEVFLQECRKKENTSTDKSRNLLKIELNANERL